MTPRNLASLPSAEPRSVAELMNAGASRWHLYGRDYERPIHGVVTRRNMRPAFEQRVYALRLKLSHGQFFSRRTAAHLHAIPVARSPHDLVELGAVRPSRPLRRPQVKGHQLRAGALSTLPSPPVWLPTVEDTWCLLSQVASKPELLAAADFLVSGASRFEEPASSLASLQAAVERFRGCAGATLRAQVLPLVRTGVESPAESRLRLLIIDAGLPEPQTCCPVHCENRTLHADLGYPALKIAIEYDGAYHFGGDAIEQARRDITRIRAMEAAGWKVLRVTAHDLRASREFLGQLAAAILDRQRRA